MNLYLLTAVGGVQSCVVAAEDEDAARETLPDSFLRWDVTVTPVETHEIDFEVKIIGWAVDGVQPGVICASPED